MASYQIMVHQSCEAPKCFFCSISNKSGVKQGSVLSPSLFLIVMNSLLNKMCISNNEGSLHGTFVGIAIHADDVRSIAPNIHLNPLIFSHLPPI